MLIQTKITEEWLINDFQIGNYCFSHRKNWLMSCFFRWSCFLISRVIQCGGLWNSLRVGILMKLIFLGCELEGTSNCQFYSGSEVITLVANAESSIN